MHGGLLLTAAALSQPRSYNESQLVVVVDSDSPTAEILYTMEEPVEGRWKKWTTNGGIVDPRVPELLEFSRWTHEHSGGYLMVTDLQGVELQHARGWHLADPAVLCPRLR